MTLSHIGALGAPRFSAYPMQQFLTANSLGRKPHTERPVQVRHTPEAGEQLSLGHVHGNLKTINLDRYPAIKTFLQTNPHTVYVSENNKPFPYLVLNLKRIAVTPQTVEALQKELVQITNQNKHLKGIQVRASKVEPLVPFVQAGYQLEATPGLRKRNAQVAMLVHAAKLQTEGKQPSKVNTMAARLLGLNLKQDLSSQLPFSVNYSFQVVLFKPSNSWRH